VVAIAGRHALDSKNGLRRGEKKDLRERLKTEILWETIFKKKIKKKKKKKKKEKKRKRKDLTRRIGGLLWRLSALEGREKDFPVSACNVSSFHEFFIIFCFLFFFFVFVFVFSLFFCWSS
jgi:hypothetical protein